MAAGGKGAEIKAGIVVLVGLVILAGGLFLVSGGWDMFTKKNLYTVLFANAGGIVEGDSVYLAGQKVGSVFDVTTKDVVEEGVTRKYVAVQIEIAESAVLHVDSEITIAQTVTGIVSMNIEYGKSGEVASPETDLRGRKRATFEEAIDEGAKLLKDAELVIQHIDEMIQEADLGVLQDKAEQLLDNLNGAAMDVREIVANAKDPIAATLSNARDASGKADAFVADVQSDWDTMEPKVQRTLDNAEGATGTVKNIAEENRERIKDLLQTLADGTKRLGPALEKAEVMVKEINDTVAEARPHLTEALRKARGAMANFEEATEDLKNHPWKLVNRPSGAEAEAVHLYNTATRYVRGVEKIRSLVDDLDTLQRLGILENQENAEVVGDLLQKLEESLEGFDESQEALLREIGGGAPPKKN